ncbi:MAG TPA: maleylpyruvate isomerase family mycothiol-dependent enzyme [Mycobacterium sp.]|nr:maleylpyruvate isomerase family mycothiol-dependent enzyme [Mycobacterium sp.]
MNIVSRPEPMREPTVAGLLAEYGGFADLIAELDATAWARPTRCVGWQVCDVAGHVVGQLIDTVSGAAGRRTADEQAAAMRDQPPSALAADLRANAESFAQLSTVFDDTNWGGPSPIPDLTLGEGVHALLNDAYVHADDIRTALGLPADNGSGLQASLDFVLGALIGDDASTDPRIAKLLGIPAAEFAGATGFDAHDFLLAATGRLNAARLGLPTSINIYR